MICAFDIVLLLTQWEMSKKKWRIQRSPPSLAVARAAALTRNLNPACSFAATDESAYSQWFATYSIAGFKAMLYNTAGVGECAFIAQCLACRDNEQQTDRQQTNNIL